MSCDAIFYQTGFGWSSCMNGATGGLGAFAGSLSGHGPAGAGGTDQNSIFFWIVDHLICCNGAVKVGTESTGAGNRGSRCDVGQEKATRSTRGEEEGARCCRIGARPRDVRVPRGLVAALLTTHTRQGGLRVGGVDAGMVCWDGVRQLFDCAFQLLPLCQTWSSWQGVKRVTRKEKRMELMMQLFRFWLIDVDARGYRLPRASARTQAL